MWPFTMINISMPSLPLIHYQQLCLTVPIPKTFTFTMFLALDHNQPYFGYIQIVLVFFIAKVVAEITLEQTIHQVLLIYLRLVCPPLHLVHLPLHLFHIPLHLVLLPIHEHHCHLRFPSAHLCINHLVQSITPSAPSRMGHISHSNTLMDHMRTWMVKIHHGQPLITIYGFVMHTSLFKRCWSTPTLLVNLTLHLIKSIVQMANIISKTSCQETGPGNRQ